MGVTMGDPVIPPRSAAPPVPPQAPVAQPLPQAVPPSIPTRVLASAPSPFSDHISLGVELRLSAGSAPDARVTQAFSPTPFTWIPRFPARTMASYLVGAPLPSIQFERPATFGLGMEAQPGPSLRERFTAALSGPLQSFEFQSTPTSILGFSGGLSVGWFDGRVGIGLIAGIPGLGSGILSYKPGFLMPQASER